MKTKADELSLQFVTEGSYTTNVGSRLCMINGEDKHKMFHLKNREFTFTVMIPWFERRLVLGANGGGWRCQQVQEVQQDGWRKVRNRLL